MVDIDDVVRIWSWAQLLNDLARVGLAHAIPNRVPRAGDGVMSRALERRGRT